ncbi:MAG: M28 family peptidase, partial [Trueperaceae bacterium]
MHKRRAAETAPRLEARVRALALPEGRSVGTPGHDAARAQLTEALQEAGLEPYGEAFALTYRERGLDFANLIGVAPGRNRTAPPVLIGAHYDTAGAMPGADDNAAAVAIALEVAERLVGSLAERDVLI